MCTFVNMYLFFLFFLFTQQLYNSVLIMFDSSLSKRWTINK